MATVIYRAKIVRGDQQFEVEGDQEFVTRMLERYTSSIYKTLDPNNLSLKEEANKYLTTQISAWEFIRRLGYKKSVDITLGLAYYLDKYSGKSEFSLADIKNLYYESKLETRNISQTILQNIKRGHITEAKNRASKTIRLYRITRVGEGRIEEELRSSKFS